MKSRDEKRQDEFCTRKGVKAILGCLSDDTLNNKIHDPTFPKPERQTGRGNSGKQWRVSAIHEWMERRASRCYVEEPSSVTEMYKSFWSRAEDTWRRLDEKHRKVLQEEVFSPLWRRLDVEAKEIAERIVGPDPERLKAIRKSAEKTVMDPDTWNTEFFEKLKDPKFAEVAIQDWATEHQRYYLDNKKRDLDDIAAEVRRHLGAALMENGQIFVLVVDTELALDGSSEKVFSHNRPAEYAELDEALEQGLFNAIRMPTSKSFLDLEDEVALSNEARAKPEAIAAAKARNENRQRLLIASLAKA